MLQSALTTVSSQHLALSLPPSAAAQDSSFSLPASASPAAAVAATSGPSSPALSATSTADGEDGSSSPILPSLPAPVLSDRVRDILRTPPPASSPRPPPSSTSSDRVDNSPRDFAITSWGSPYPDSDREKLRLQALSENDSDLSESSEDEPIHRLDLPTPFLRPPPDHPRALVDTSAILPSASASVLANRARRPARGLTEDWIRQHTDANDSAENYLWLSDNDANDSGTATISGHSSLRSSFSGGITPWNLSLGKRAGASNSPKPTRRSLSRFLANESKRSSLETLRAASHSYKPTTMTADSDATHGPSAATEKPLPPPPPLAASSSTDQEVSEPASAAQPPIAPADVRRTSSKEQIPARVRKKIPWKGKCILFCLPREDRRGLDGNMPLSAEQVDQLYREWENLGYQTAGWSLETPIIGHALEDAAQSRIDWPSSEDIAIERKNKYKVVLPDLDAWAKYTADLQEAKLRALGVLTAAEVPIPATPSPAPSLMTHRRISTMQHPGQVYSPPIPTSSAGSFIFPAQFNRAGMNQSPGINSVPTPVSMGGHPAKYNARQSISIPSHSPFQMNQPSPNWAQQNMMMHGLHRAESPMGYPGAMSPSSPFQPTGSPAMNMHQRHQSMQYPMMSQPYQPMPPRRTPMMQEIVHEEEEEEEQVQQNNTVVEPVQNLDTDLSTQQEEIQQSQPQDQQNAIEDQQYHLEKQLEKDFEHADYNPNNDDVVNSLPQSTTTFAPQPAHTRQQSSVQFAALPTTQFAASNTVLHHPRPHSRGHSLANNFYMGDKVTEGSDDSNSLANQLRSMTQVEPQQTINEFAEVPTDQSVSETPDIGFDFTKHVTAHQHTFSTVSNPWQDVTSGNRSVRQSSHGSKASMSGLNADAPVFKFNPASNFTPSSFNFGASASSSTFEPFQGPSTAVNATPPSTKISASAATFSPGQSEFSFSSFRPNAPAFTPSTQAQSEAYVSSMFGNVEIPEVENLTNKSKAIPIVVPSDKNTEEASCDEDAEGRPTNHARAKRARAFGFGRNTDDEDAQPLFAEPQEAPGNFGFNNGELEEGEIQSDTAADDEVATPVVDTSVNLSSAVQSEPTDTKPSSANSPSAESIGQRAANWAPFELESKQEMLNFSQARPFGDNWTPAPAPTTLAQKPGHKKSLSVTAKVFVPGAAAYHTEPEAESEADIHDVDVAAELDELVKEEELAAQSGSQPEELETTPTPETFVPQVLEKKTTVSENAPSTNNSRRLDTPTLPPPRGLMSSRFASPPRGLKASRFASPSPTRDVAPSNLENDGVSGDELEEDELVDTQLQENASPGATNESDESHTPTFEEINDIMLAMNKDPNMGVHKTISGSHQSGPNRQVSIAAVAGTFAFENSPEQDDFYHSGSLSPARHKQFVDYSGDNVGENAFMGTPRSGSFFAGPIHRLNRNRNHSEAPSDWDGTFTGDDEGKLGPRATFFDGRVNQLVDEVLAARLQPLEKALETIQDSLFSGRERRSRNLSDDIQLSDADDEDDEPMPVCPVSPRKEKRMELIRSAVAEAISQHTNLMTNSNDNNVLAQAIEDIKAHIASPPRAALLNDEIPSKTEEMQARILDLEQRLHLEESRVHKEINDRRAAEDRAAELERNLQSVESRLNNEVAQRASMDSRYANLETKLRHEEERVAEQVDLRHAAQDEAAESQRLLRVSSKEEARLQHLTDEQSHKIRSLEQELNKASRRMTLLEAANENTSQAKSVDSSRLSTLESGLEAARKDAQKWQSEAEAKNVLAERYESQALESHEEVKQLQKVLATLGMQLEENERIRENWRNKFISLQEDMTSASHQFTEENARRMRHEQALLARQDVLDAKLQAEACTRERLEKELERLEGIERQGMRAMNENKQLEELLVKMRGENHELQQAVMRYRLEFEEARESGANEVQRTRFSMQSQVDEANNQVNVARVELEEHIAALRLELDNVKLDADSSKARTEMMVEDANETKDRAIKELTDKYTNEMEDLHTRYQHKLSLVTDEAQTREQLLLERLSLSTSKTEHLQDRMIHLEDKLEIAKQAAVAAAQQATRNSTSSTAGPTSAASRGLTELPEKISPQALRESIMVLQEQLQAREHRIEELEEATADLDPDMEAKITKRDDEIVWLRELLAVRHADLQDVIAALSADSFDRERVKDAAIRLKANLQMEEQERERAMNGGSAIKLPRLAKTFTDAATPRVAQAVGPLAAAWGNWRKGQPAFASIRSSATTSLVGSASTAPLTKSSAAPSAATSTATTPTTAAHPESTATPGAASSNLSGLLTPPGTSSRVISSSSTNNTNMISSSTSRAPPLSAASFSLADDTDPQPTAFSATGRRLTSGTHGARQPQQLDVSRTRGISHADSISSAVGGIPMASGAASPPRELRTPPMMKAHAYDPDAQINGFDDDDDFFED
ncbi:uncharacterized protein BROUX77_005029 [Berkeleyomyces rouxiae]|uniref:uncharacterized protein n=1 Tax=Berkeleyomyces rouxiae TaxID=2035830 RepID=UPI003B7B601C